MHCINLKIKNIHNPFCQTVKYQRKLSVSLILLNLNTNYFLIEAIFTKIVLFTKQI